ncbi:Hypothetical predicted protein [Mytilus galloprovincialis]|uniref:C1q domain-containing protein n=1 Tax=Mytilus galloprovincialis TaxID=29158 RepID=A0A8B6D039_MYTGA|nr:Hypothetical predicted protein [Mytilus galloprovincialis]
MPAAITEDLRRGISKELPKRIIPSLDGRVPTASSTAAFYALMTLHNERLGIHQPIVFQNVITNDGNGYDKNTGVFKAAVAGTYSFTTTIMSHWTQDISVELIKDGHNVGSIYCGNTATYGVGSQSVIIHMAVGDDFWVRVADNSHNTGNNKIYGGGFSSISGFLINSL